VPEIEQQYLDCSIYLYSSEESAWAGENSGGSGFLVSVKPFPLIDSDHVNPVTGIPRILLTFPPHIYAVTNKHVARRGFPIVRLNTIDGTKDVLPLQHSDWIPHPDGDDLVVAPIDLPADKHQYVPVSVWSFADREGVAKQYYGAGTDTFMVGRFFSHAGEQRNTPSLRFGSIAMLPFEKVKLGPEANSYMQEAFLVETRSLGGFSGSPVFVYQPRGEVLYDENYGWLSRITELVGHPQLLGIDCGHITKSEPVKDGGGNPHSHGWRVASNTGMAIVIPAWRLKDLLDKPELVMQREEKNKKYQKEKETEETVAMDVEESPFTGDSYQDALRRASRKVSEPEPEAKKK
jgi:hypothetical protein